MKQNINQLSSYKIHGFVIVALILLTQSWCFAQGKFQNLQIEKHSTNLKPHVDELAIEAQSNKRFDAELESFAADTTKSKKQKKDDLGMYCYASSENCKPENL